MMIIMKDYIKETKDSLLKSVKVLHELLDEQRLALLYLNFDVEACNREKVILQKEINRLRGSK